MKKETRMSAEKAGNIYNKLKPFLRLSMVEWSKIDDGNEYPLTCRFSDFPEHVFVVSWEPKSYYKFSPNFEQFLSVYNIVLE